MALPRIAETGDVHIQSLELATDNSQVKLLLRGLIFHSAIVAENIRVVSEKDAARILVEMAPTHSGKSGSFTVTVPLSPDIAKVTFGTSGKQIWSREYRFQ